MAISHKGAISFGLVHIPVNLYTATQDSDIGFNQLHKADHSRIRYKKVCTHCGKEVKNEDIVKGFQYEKDKYVVVTDAEIEKIKSEKDKSIRILQFAALNEISPIYYDKAYYVLPDKGGDKALELLRAAMMQSNKAAIGKSVFGNQEKLLVIIPREDGVLIQTLMYRDDIKDIPAKFEQSTPLKAELTMAQQLIDSMSAPFDASAYKDEFQEKLRGLISAKIAGKDVKKPLAEGTGGKILSLMDALKASVEQSKPKAAQKTKAPARKKA